MRCNGRNSVKLNALIEVKRVRAINDNTYSHRLLCTKMADAWANQITTSPHARDENVLYAYRIAVQKFYTVRQYWQTVTSNCCTNERTSNTCSINVELNAWPTLRHQVKVCEARYKPLSKFVIKGCYQLRYIKFINERRGINKRSTEIWDVCHLPRVHIHPNNYYFLRAIRINDEFVHVHVHKYM